MWHCVVFLFESACPVLVRSFGNMLNCLERNEHLVCEVGCSPGYSFVQNNLPLKEYKCGPSTGYTWNGLTPACGSKKIDLFIIKKGNWKIPANNLTICSCVLQKQPCQIIYHHRQQYSTIQVFHATKRLLPLMLFGKISMRYNAIPMKIAI